MLMGEPGEWLHFSASKPDPSYDRSAGRIVRGKCMLEPYISNMAPKILCFVMARGVLDRVLENSEVLQEFTEQIITKLGCTEKNVERF
jgi:hypothetical protein